jgi:hypothetical protein
MTAGTAPAGFGPGVPVTTQKPKAVGPPPGFSLPENKPPPGFGEPHPQATPTAVGSLEWSRQSIPSLPKYSSAGEKLLPVLDTVADKGGVPRSVARAVFAIEAGWTSDPLHAGDVKGAYGPAQIEAANVSGQPHFDRSNATQAFQYMVQGLGQAYKKYGDWGLAAGAYNTGGGAIDQWLHGGGTLDNVTAVTNQITGQRSNDVRAYMLRVRGAFMGEEFDRQHKAAENADAAVTQRRVQSAVNAAKQELGRMTMRGPSGQFHLKQSSPMVNLEGPLQAVGAYLEMITAASPLVGALAGRHPIPSTYDLAKSVHTAGVEAIGKHLEYNPFVALLGGPGIAAAQAMKHFSDIVGAASDVGVIATSKARNLGDIAAAEGDVLHAAARGPQALADAESRYSVGSPGFMRALTGNRDTHPRGDATLRTALDFIGPGSGELNGAKWAFTKVLAALGDRIPAVERAMVAAAHQGDVIRASPVLREIQRWFSPTAILRHGATDLGIDPEEAVRLGRNFNGAEAHAYYNAALSRKAVFADLTREQRIEVERRSEALGGAQQAPNHNVAEPTKGSSLDERAALHRGMILAMDDQSLAYSLIDKKRIFDPNRYTYRGGARGKVYQFDATSDVLDYYGHGARRGGRGAMDTAGAQGGHKIYETYDDAEASGHLASAYDPSDNFERFLKTRGTRVALESSLNDLGELGFRREMTYRDPDSGAPLAGSLGLSTSGRGEVGMAAARNLGKRKDDAIALVAGAKAAGISLDQIRTIRRANPEAVQRLIDESRKHIALASEGTAGVVKKAQGVESRLEGREATTSLKEQQSQADLDAARSTPTQKITSKTSEDAAAAATHFNAERDSALRSAQKAAAVATGAASEAGRASRVVSDADLGKSVARAIYGPNSTMERRLKNLDDRLAEAQFNKAKAERLQRAIDAHLEEHQYNTFKRIQANAERDERISGYVPGADVARDSRLKLPSLEPWFSYHPALASFVKEMGATPAEANAFSKLFSGFNNLYRIGIIYNPIRHLFINMPFNFLGSGGTVTNLVRAFTHVTPEEIQRATEAGAVKHVASNPLFGGSSGTSFDTPLRDVFKEAYDKAYDLAGGHKDTQSFAGFGAMLNAAGSRLWAGNARLVFDWGETRLATARFMQHVEDEGLTDAEAANRVSQMFGSALDLSKTGVDAKLHKALLFYPWLKATIPLMMRAMYRAPSVVWVPYARSVDWNRATQDPRWRQETEGTYHLGNWCGKDVYMSWPGPQKYLEDVLSVFDPGGDTTGGLTPRVSKLVNLATSELKPVPLGIPISALATEAGKPAEPGPPNFETLWNNAAPPRVQLSQATASMLQRLPFGEIVSSTVGNVNQLLGGNPSSFLSALSIVPYARPSPQVEQGQRKVFNAYVEQSGKIEKAIRTVHAQPGLSEGKELKVAALRDQQMVAYIVMKAKAQMLDPSVTAKDKQTIMKQAQTLIKPIQLEMSALSAGAARIQAMQQQQQTPAAAGSPPPGFGPAQQ